MPAIGMPTIGMPFTCYRVMLLHVLAYRTEHAACEFTELSILRLQSINRSKLHAKYVKSGLNFESARPEHPLFLWPVGNLTILSIL